MAVAQHIARGLVLRCPSCGKGRLYRRVFVLRDTCGHCEQPFLRDSGDWTGGAEITIIGGAFVAFAAFFAMSALTDWSFPLIVALVLATALVAIPLVYRHVKGAWVGAIRAWEGPDPEPRPVMEPDWFVEHWERERNR